MSINGFISVRDMRQWGARPERQLVGFLRAACDFIERQYGNFIPYTDTKRFDGNGDIDLVVPPLISITSISDDGTSLSTSDYLLYPRNGWFDGKPFTRIRIDPDSTLRGVWTWEEDIVVIAGKWGLWEETEEISSVSSQTDSSNNLVVGDASSLAPGMVVLIDSEQEYIRATGAATDSTANLSEDVDITETEITISDGTAVNIGEIVVVDTEQLLILDIIGNVLVVMVMGVGRM